MNNDAANIEKANTSDDVDIKLSEKLYFVINIDGMNVTEKNNPNEYR